jgi:hypothetical protein
MKSYAIILAIGRPEFSAIGSKAARWIFADDTRPHLPCALDILHP